MKNENSLRTPLERVLRALRKQKTKRARRLLAEMHPAEIALLARVPILVVIGCDRQGQPQLDTPGLIEAVRMNQESMSQAARRITQTLADILEHYLRQYPEQWYYLPKLANYFVSDRGLDALQL